MKNGFVILVAIMTVTTSISAQNCDLPQVAISPLKMNILYIGIDNPMAIAISGVPSENVSATISQGTLSKVSGGEYNAKPISVGEARINVSAEIDTDGEKRYMESIMVFRVKSIPTPIAKVAGKVGGVIGKDALLSQRNVIAVLEDFLIDVKFVVTQFDVGISTSEGCITERSNSPAFTERQKTLINRLEAGQRVFIANIKAQGQYGGCGSEPSFVEPDGVKDLADITFTIE